MADEPVGLTVDDRDPVREYSADEQRQLTVNLERLLTSVGAGTFSQRPLTVDVLDELHRALFSGVRGHAGHHRSRGYGQERLAFGPNRSVHRNDVPKSLREQCQRAEARVRELERGDWSSTGEVRSAIEVAARIHAEIIRIHPYEDGNGRTSRAVMSIVLVRLGLNPIPVEVPKNEYLECLNHFFKANELEPLVALLVRLYPL